MICDGSFSDHEIVAAFLPFGGWHGRCLGPDLLHARARVEPLTLPNHPMQQSTSFALALVMGAAVAAPHARAETPPEPPKVTTKSGKGITVTAADGRNEVSLRARVQLRDTVTVDDGEPTNEAGVKTLRLTLQGHVLDEKTKYSLQLAFGAGDFEADNPSPIYDAWVESKHLRDLNVRIGQYLAPLDRARTLRESALELIDRPQVVRELALDRDVGITLYSNDLFGSDVLGYHLYLGTGDGKNHTGPMAPGPLVVGRLVVRPFGYFEDDVEGDLERDPRARLAVAVAAAYNHDTERVRSNTGASFENTDADYYHEAVDLVFKCSGVSLLAELIARRASTDSTTTVVDGEPVTEWTRSGYGYFVQPGVMLTKKVELAARWEELFALSGTDPALVEQADTLGRAFGGGLSVYLNGHAFKLQTDYNHSFHDDVTEGPHVVRFAVDASF